MFMRILLCFLALLLSISIHSVQSPNEEKIYFHIHQATRWAELHFQKNAMLAKQEMRNHLGKIKYSEVNLVKSLFYKDFLFLNKLSVNLKNSSLSEVENFRSQVHVKAEKFKVKHPENWEDEFILVQ